MLLDFFAPKSNLNYSSFNTYLTKKEVDLFNLQEKKLSTDQQQSVLSIYFLTDYKDQIIQDLIHRVKFSKEWGIAQDLSKLMSVHTKGFTPDIITFVPADPEREKERGFHLPKILARNIANLNNWKFVELLRKVKHTEAQTNKNREERLVNLQNVFGLYPKIYKNKVDLSTCKNILIIDDVSTTGTTIVECAKFLKSLDSELNIIGLVIASSELN